MGMKNGERKGEGVMEVENGGSELMTKSEKAMVEEPTAEKMKELSLKKQHFVLVHGVNHGAWCWYKVKSLMENSGYKVTCVDLKGAGRDQTDPNTIFTLDEYNEPLLDLLAALPDDEKVILVGHSAGGLNVTDATLKFPNKISLAVYVAATMLRSGFVTEQDVKDGIPDLSGFGDFSEVHDIEFGLGQDQPPTSVVIKKELLRKINYQMSPQEDSTLAEMLVRPGPIRALTSVRFDQVEDVDKVPRIYIKTMHDRAVKTEQQVSMIKSWPPLCVYELESDHSPFFSAPSMLVGLLFKAATSLGVQSLFESY